MTCITSAAAKLGHQIYSLYNPVVKGAKAGVGFAVSVANQANLTAAGAIYVNYLIATAALDSLAKYTGQYSPLQNGFQDVGFTPSSIGKYFGGQGVSPNSWNILNYSFDPKNLKDIQDILREIYESIENPLIMQVMTAQVLTKLLVGKNAHYLINGALIQIPVVDENGNKQFVDYRLDKKFDLGGKIPAFGFSSKVEGYPPLLIFRSTNLRLEEIDTLPAIVANLHPEGPGWKLFTHSQKEILNWLEDKTKQGAQKARTVGYSLGGALAAYYLTYHPQYFNQAHHNPSIILDAPGVNSKIEKKWTETAEKPLVFTFVNRGDLIPKVGNFLIGRAFEVRQAQNLYGFESHHALSLFAPQWKIIEISTHCEKKSKARSLFSGLRKLIGGAIYKPIQKILLPCAQKILHGELIL